MMNCEGLILFALLVGGDYDKVHLILNSHSVNSLTSCLQGIENCGKSTAFGVIKYRLRAVGGFKNLNIKLRGRLGTEFTANHGFERQQSSDRE